LNRRPKTLQTEHPSTSLTDAEPVEADEAPPAADLSATDALLDSVDAALDPQTEEDLTQKVIGDEDYLTAEQWMR